jgi:hypothetical protein
MNNLPLDVKCHKVFYVGNLFCANETWAYNIKHMVQNKRYWKGHIAKPLLFILLYQMKCTHASFVIVRLFLSLDVVHVYLLLLVTCHHQGIVISLFVLVSITILVPKERIERL